MIRYTRNRIVPKPPKPQWTKRERELRKQYLALEGQPTVWGGRTVRIVELV